MITGAFANALKGIGGEYEITRLIGGFGALAYILGAHIFLVWNQLNGQHFDLISYCAAFPAGLGVAIGATAGASALKDRGVATSKVIQETGAVPTRATPEPQKVEVTNEPGNPVPTTTEGQA